MAFAVKSEFGESGFDVWDEWSQGYKKYSRKDARAVWRSAKSSGAGASIGIGTLFKKAQEAGWERRPLDEDDRRKLAEQAAQRRVQREKDERIEQARIKRMHEAVSHAAGQLLGYTRVTGVSQYLGAKRVGAHGLRFFKRAVVLVADEDTCTHRVIDDHGQIMEFLKTANHDEVSFKYLKRGVIAVPMQVEGGRIVNLQFIFSSGKKSFMKGGQKQGAFHLVGEVSDVLVIVEGYATGASIHEATGYPVAVAFDAGNLLPVAKVLRRQYPDCRFVFAADDDRDVEENPGKTKAENAAAVVGGVVVLPKFPEVAA